jgi:3D (Asp-Asp-Asp) domain-containing protein
VEADPDEYYTVQSEDGVYDITVNRDDAVTVWNCGEEMSVRIEDETVGAMLDRMGIPTGENYHVSCDLSTALEDGMTVTVNHEVTMEEVYTVEVPFETTTVEDPYLLEGTEQVLTEGVVGQMLYTAEVEYRNTEEISRNIKSKEVIREAQKQVVAVGTGEKAGQKADAPLIGDGVIVLPSGEVLTYYKTDSFVATAYTQYDDGCDSITATQTPVKWGVVAVDPSVVPYGTRMFIMDEDGGFIYGLGTAEDCGTGIDGKRLDLFMHTLSEAFSYGRRSVTVYFLGDANWTY